MTSPHRSTDIPMTRRLNAAFADVALVPICFYWSAEDMVVLTVKGSKQAYLAVSPEAAIQKAAEDVYGGL